jgi:hypothetical protein
VTGDENKVQGARIKEKGNLKIPLNLPFQKGDFKEPVIFMLCGVHTGHEGLL